MKKLLILALLFFLIGNVKSQDRKLQFEVGPTLAIPFGNTDLGKVVGVGAEGIVSCKMTDHINYFGQTGIFYFSGKTAIGFGASDNPTTHVPLLVGLRYTCDKGFIAGLGVGCGFYNSSHGYTREGFEYSPQIGYSFKKIVFLAKYNGTIIESSHLSYLGLSLLYKF